MEQATQPSSHSKIQHLQVIIAGNLNHALRQPCAILPRGGLRGLELQVQGTMTPSPIFPIHVQEIMPF